MSHQLALRRQISRRVTPLDRRAVRVSKPGAGGSINLFFSTFMFFSVHLRVRSLFCSCVWCAAGCASFATCRHTATRASTAACRPAGFRWLDLRYIDAVFSVRYRVARVSFQNFGRYLWIGVWTLGTRCNFGISCNFHQFPNV
jgi:hypothetical protein